MAEKLIADASGARPVELRFFAFDGRVAMVNAVVVDGGRIRNGAFFTRRWERLDWHFSGTVDRAFDRPRRLDAMLSVAESIADGFDHLRVDMLDSGERFFVGELTPYSWSGLFPFAPDRADFDLGKAWTLQRPLLRALDAIVFRERRIGAGAS